MTGKGVAIEVDEHTYAPGADTPQLPRVDVVSPMDLTRPSPRIRSSRDARAHEGQSISEITHWIV
jgi:hypothetical protein